MNPNQTAAFKTLEQAQQALKSGDKNASRQLAAHAVQLAPELEEVWLLMAALATPQDSIALLQKALQINPQSERAVKGLAWAKKRISQETQIGMTAPNIPLHPVTPEEISAPPIRNAPEPQIGMMASDIPLHPVTPEEISAPPIRNTPEPRQITQNLVISPAEPGPVKLPGSITQPHKISSTEHEPATTLADAPKTPRSKDSFVLPRYSYVALLGVFICLVIAWLAWQGVQPAAAFFSSHPFTGQEHGPAWAPVSIVKPAPPLNTNEIIADPTATNITPADLAPTALAPSVDPSTLTETPAPAAVVLSTDIPVVMTATQQIAAILPTNTQIVVTATPQPTAIPPTSVPAPTLPAPTIPVPTDPPLPTATTIATLAVSTLVVDAAASPTPLPTDTGGPFATPLPPGNSGVVSSAGSGHWIDVDLTNQMVYAYDGNNIVNSFLVSTGTWAHPTVTGQYHVYVKYRYTDMSGPGYYLPNVPFTMYFYQGYALHGTYWHSNFGTPMSHGCVNLSIPDSEWVYNFSSVGTLVNVHY